MSGADFPIFSDELGLRSSEKLETPDVWGKSFDKTAKTERFLKSSLNPRLVGQVFRLKRYGKWAVLL